MEKKAINILAILIISGITLWFFRIDIEDYLFSKHAIYWEKNVLIAPSDFNAKVPHGVNSKLSCYFGFKLKHNNTQDAQVDAIFDKSKSWISDTTNYKKIWNFNNYDLIYMKFMPENLIQK